MTVDGRASRRMFEPIDVDASAPSWDFMLNPSCMFRYRSAIAAGIARFGLVCTGFLPS